MHEEYLNAEQQPFMDPTDSMTDDLTWDAAVVVAREMIRYRRSEPLSKAVISSDPNGTLILTRDDYDRITPGMSADQVISIIGSEPCRDDQSPPQQLQWVTMGGSYVHVIISRKDQAVTAKSYSNVIAQAFGIKSFCGNDWPPRSQSARSRWPTLSTTQIGKFFLKHSSQQQQRWFQSAMSGAVQFRIEKIGGRPSIQFQFDREEPELSGTPAAGHLTDLQVDNLWQTILQLGSNQALFARNKLMDAVNQCDNFCTTKSRKELLAVVQQGDYLKAEQLQQEILAKHDKNYVSDIAKQVARREAEGPVYGRDYQKDEEGPLWHWYKVLIHRRDDYRCQYCGISNVEHEDPLYHVDHIVPVSRGGKTELSNLQTVV